MFHNDKHPNDEHKIIRIKINSEHPKGSKGSNSKGWTVYHFIKELEGRGQSGSAGFYKKQNETKQADETQNETFLVKRETKPGVCVFEGSAGFAQSLILDVFKTCVNFAQVGQAKMDDEIVAVSIQPKLDGYKPWDIVITGEKRDPNTIYSFESNHKEDILFSISSMTDHAKNQLAMGIFISQLVGDESLHVGQFMVKEEQGLITEVTRIDLGARERFAIKRIRENDFNHETSHAYKYSGQLDKDYISYLLAHPDIYAKVMQFWKMTEIDEKTLARKYKEEFRKQFNNLPVAEFDNAVNQIKEIIYKGENIPKQNRPIHNCAQTLSIILKNRIRDYKRNAIANIVSTVNAACKELPEKIGKKIKSIIFTDPIGNEMINDYYEIIKYLTEKKPNAAIIILSQLQAEFQSRSFYHQTSEVDKAIYDFAIIELKNLKIKFQMLEELKNYQEKIKNDLNVDQKDIISEQITALEENISKYPVLVQDIDSLITTEFINTFSQPIPVTRLIFLPFSDDTGAKLITRFKNYSYDCQYLEKKTTPSTDIATSTTSTSTSTSTSLSSPNPNVHRIRGQGY